MEVIFIGYSYDTLTSVEMHQHTYWEIVLFLKGTGMHTIGKRKIRFSPKMIILQPPNIEHGTVADTKYQDIYIAIKDFVPPIIDKIPIYTDDEENRFMTLVDLMHSAFHKRESNYEQLVQAFMQAIYQMLIGWSIQKPKNNFVDQAKNELILNFSNPRYKTTALLENSHYSSDHFRRRFKKEAGTTPTSYLINLRIEHAKQLLGHRETTGLPIKDIALTCGFSNPYYFSRLFKERTGLSPSDFRDSFKFRVNLKNDVK